MGLWKVAGRWLVWVIGLLLVFLGGGAIWQGIDIIQVERGWTSVIAGTTALCSGFLILILGVLIDHVDSLRLAMLDRRATLPTAPVLAPEPELPVIPEPVPERGPEIEPANSLEAPVEAQAKLTPTFSFRPFGKRQPGVVPPLPPEEPLPPLAEVPPAPEPIIPEPQPAEPSEQVRRFAPPQFRRPSFMRPAREPEPDPAPEVAPVPVAAAAAPEPIVEPAPVLPPPPLPPIPAPVEETVLPRAVPLPPLPPVVAVAPEPEPQPEPVVAPRSVAQQHEWLEKALTSDEAEPALDWLRKRRPEPEAQPDKPIPSFMLRREETPGAQASGATPPATQAAAADGDKPDVVGRYSANGADYTLYADGTIDAQMPDGIFRFASMTELRAHLEKQVPTASA